MTIPPRPVLLGLVFLATVLGQGAPARASGFGATVESYCLAAFQQEMAQAGKVAPEGMAAYACRCVVDRITEGTSLSTARSSCRESTARRYAP